MGTRHLIVVQLDGEYKVAQYGQWDGHPEGKGVGVLKFLHEDEDNFDAFKEKLRKVRFVNDDVVQGYFDKYEEIPVEFDRNTSAKILYLIKKGEIGELFNYIDFAKKSLMCEFVYVIDFDKNTFEVYEGFQKQPVPEDNRFQGEAVLSRKGTVDEEAYYPVKLIKEYSLDNLPMVKEFLDYFEEAMKEDDEK